jgi:hypothetical protein
MHSRSGDNLTAHPEAAGIIRQASGFPRFDEFPGPRLALPAVQLDHRHGIWQVKTKLPHRVGEMGHPRRRFWRQQEIYGRRAILSEKLTTLSQHAASGAIPSTRHHCLPVQPTRNISCGRGRASPAVPGDDAPGARHQPHHRCIRSRRAVKSQVTAAAWRPGRLRAP